MRACSDLAFSRASRSAASASAGNPTLDFLLLRMRHRSDFPALSDSVSRIQRVANSEHHNLHSLAAQLRVEPDHDRVWAKFKGGRERTLAMSRELVDALALRVDARIARALRAALLALQEAADPTPANP